VLMSQNADSYRPMSRILLLNIILYSYVIVIIELPLGLPRLFEVIQRIRKQESRAIAKITVRCALYMDALKNFGSPWLRPWLLIPKRSSKVVDFCTNRKRVCDFLLVRHSNFGPILYRFGDIAGFVLLSDPTPIPP